jgi:hypothetical protein
VSTATHTPTPWAELEMPGRSDRIVRDDEDCSLVCEFSYGLNADSAFIVRACNAHDDLVAALKRADNYFRCVLGWNDQDDMVRTVGAALAKAEGGAA